MTYHWQAPPPPEVWNVGFAFDVRRTGGPVSISRPRVISVPIGRPAVRARSYQFFGSDAEPPPAAVKKPSAPARSNAVFPGRTRIKPPRDVIKLADRLEYLLQPSLESLLEESSLKFPHRPFPFQFEGIAFLYPRHAAVLADEMGLGKTMQAITAIRLLLRRGEVKTVLLVCPKPLVTNWQREFARWAPEIPVVAIEGNQPKRNWQWRLPGVPVRIANYELLVRDIKPRPAVAPKPVAWAGAAVEPPPNQDGDPDPNATNGCGFMDVRFDLVVLDESQRIKNRESATSRTVRSIPRRRSWALTGTPVENGVEDLLGIFEFLAPGLLAPEMKPRSIGRAIGDHVLRRTKELVLADLPPKMVRDAPLELTAEQRESYRLAEEKGVLRLTGLGRSAAIRHVFELVMRLKQICNFDPATGESAKLERLAADIEEIAASGRKAIVFSQWVSTLRILARRLERFGPLEYHGQVPSAQRDAVIRRFRDDPSRHALFISYGAGGVGLNLQFVNYVFLFDRWWNPAVEDQAINRAHRIGVDGPVSVTRFLTVDTIEERIDAILQEKRELFEAIFSGAEDRRRLGLTQEELFGLFELKCPAGPIDLAA